MVAHALAMIAARTALELAKTSAPATRIEPVLADEARTPGAAVRWARERRRRGERAA